MLGRTASDEGYTAYGINGANHTDVAILYGKTDARQATLIVRLAEVAGDRLGWLIDLTESQKTDATTKMAQQFIIIR